MMSYPIAKANAGSGKTMAFLLPGIVQLYNQVAAKKRVMNKPSVLVMAPTRELALQIQEVAYNVCTFGVYPFPLLTSFQYLKGTAVKVVCCYGGENKGQQIRSLRQGIAFTFHTGLY